MLLTMCNAMSKSPACEKVIKQAKSEKDSREIFIGDFIKSIKNLGVSK